MAKKFDNEDGVWRTIGGRRVFIKNGQDLASAMKESGKFKTAKKETKKEDNISKAEKEALEKGYSQEDIDKMKKAVEGLNNMSQEEKDKEMAEFKEKEKAFWNKYDNMTKEEKQELSKEFNSLRNKGEEKVETLNSDTILDELGSDAEGVSAMYEKLGYKDEEIWDKVIEDADNEKLVIKEDKNGNTHFELNRDGKTLTYNGRASDNAPIVEEKENKDEADIKKSMQKVAEQYEQDKKEGKVAERLKENEANERKIRKEAVDPYDDPESEESQRLQDIQSRYDNYLQETEGRGASYGELAYIQGLNGKELDNFEKELDDFEEDSWKKSSPKKAKATLDNARAEQQKQQDAWDKQVSATKNKYTADEEDILERYGEDYGYDGKDNLENLRGQIDYMRNPNESINQTAQRLVEGGDFLIYNGDIQDWLKERNIKYNDDNFFDVYKKEMADKIEKLYNQGGEKAEEKGISEKRIQSLAKMYDVDRKTAERYAYFPKDIQSVKKHGGAGSYDESEWSKPKTTNETMNGAIREKASRDWNSKEDIIKEYNNYSNDIGKNISKDKFAGEYAKNLYNNGKIKLNEIEQTQKDIKNALSDSTNTKTKGKTTNETMNNAIREKASKKASREAEEREKEIEEWTRYRDKYQKSLNRATNPKSKERFKKEIDDSNRTIERLKEQQKTTNETMNQAIREKATKKTSSTPKASLSNTEIKAVKTQKALKGLISDGKVTDITAWDDKKTKALRQKHGGLEKVKITTGVYGMNGALLRSTKTGEYFVITSRNSNLFYWV